MKTPKSAMAVELKQRTTQHGSPVSPNTSTDDIQRIFRLQQGHKQVLKNTTARERVAKIKKLREKALEYQSKLYEAMHADFKKSKLEVDATELYIVSYECKEAIQKLADWMEPQHVDSPLTYFGSSSQVIHEPKGCALIISPWNYPFNLTIAPLVSAIAAGNTAMIKPSEYTVHTSALMKEMLSELFGEEEVAVIEGDHTVAKELLTRKFDHIYFTGSPSVGKIVMKAASEHLSSITLELGGKSPTIVDEKVNLKDAAEKIIWGKYLNAGQTCIAPDYVFVHESQWDRFKQQAVAQIQAYYGSDPEVSPDFCRMVNRRHFDRVSELLNDATSHGAEVVTGGQTNADDNYIAPTILANFGEDAKIHSEEIFGPLLPLFKYSNLDEVLAYINAREKPLAMYVFSKNNKNIDRLMNETSAGSTCINDTMIQFSHPNMLFGGVNNSGIGKGHGKWGYEAFTNKRAVLRQYLSTTPGKLLYPPYGAKARRVVDLLLKYF